MLGRVIVLVREDQLSLAIGKRGQNVRLGSKLVGWDIEVMTREELDEQLDRSVSAFSAVPHMTDELAETLVSQGFFSFADLSVIEPDQFQELSGLTEEQCAEIIAFADVESLKEEEEEDRRKSLEKAAKQAEAQAAALDRMTGKSLGGESASPAPSAPANGQSAKPADGESTEEVQPETPAEPAAEAEPAS